MIIAQMYAGSVTYCPSQRLSSDPAHIATRMTVMVFSSR